jgi:hypothetical protein
MLQNLEKAEVSIPKLPEERLAELRRKIQPLIRSGGIRMYGRLYDSKLYYRKEADPREDPLIPTNITRDLLIEVADNIEPFMTIRTYHPDVHGGLTKSTVADTLSQIPEEYIAKTTAFETTDLISPFIHENTVQDSTSGKFYMVAKTILYEHKDIEISLTLDDELRAILNRLSAVRRQSGEEIIKSLIRKPKI